MLTVRVYVRPVSMFHSAIYLYASADPLDPTVAWRTVGTIPKAHPSLSDVGAYGQSKWVLANGAVFVGNPEWRLIEEWTHDPLSALSTFENGTAMAAPYGVYPGTGFGLAVAASVPADGPAVVASVAPSFSPDPMVFIAAESPVFVAPSVGRDDTLFNGEAGQPVASLDMALHMACGSTAVGSANVQRIRCDAIVLLPSAAAVIPRTGVKMTHTIVSSILRLWGVREQGPNCAAFPDSGRCAAPRVWMDRGWTAGSPWPDNLERVGEEPPSSMVLVENTADVCGLWFEGPLSPTFPSRGTHFAFFVVAVRRSWAYISEMCMCMCTAADSAEAVSLIVTTHARGGLLALNHPVPTHMRSVVRSCTFDGGIAARGGCLFVENGGTIMRDMTVERCQARLLGGGVALQSTGYTDEDTWFYLQEMFDTRVTNCTSNQGAGIFSSESTLVASNLHVEDCESHMGGGGMMLLQGAAGVLIDSTITRSKALVSSGGGAFIDGSTLSTSNATISDCSSFVSGGGLYVGFRSVVHIDDTHIVGNHGGRRGGGVHVDRSTALIARSTISRNTAEGSSSVGGGGVAVTLSVDGRSTQLTDCNVTFNSGTQGGGIHMDAGAHILMQGGTLAGNTASRNGGAIHVHEGNFTVYGTHIDDNTATGGSGGGIDLTGTNAHVTLVGCHVSGNSAPAAPPSGFSGSAVGVGVGGGIACRGGADIHIRHNAHIDDNTAYTSGAGLYLESCSGDIAGSHIIGNAVSVDRSIVVRSNEGADGAGGGLTYQCSTAASAAGSAVVDIRSTAFARNTAPRGAAIAAISDYDSPVCESSVWDCVHGGSSPLKVHVLPNVTFAPGTDANTASVVGDDIYYVNRRITDTTLAEDAAAWPRIASSAANLTFLAPKPDNAEASSIIHFEVRVLDAAGKPALPPAGTLALVRSLDVLVALSGATSAAFVPTPVLADSVAVFDAIRIAAPPGEDVAILVDLLPSYGVGAAFQSVYIHECEPGFQVASTGIACTACGVGTANANDTSSQTACQPCDAGTEPDPTRVSCVACSPGWVSSTGGACTICASGSAPSADHSECVKCAPGMYTPAAGEPKCLSCGPGSVSAEGASQCTVCEPGKFANTTAWTCDACGDGTIAPGSATTECQSCLAGKFMNELRTKCSDCSGNTRSADEAVECTACNPGWVTVDKKTCAICPAGTWSNAATSSCDPCPPGTASNSPGTPNATQCVACPVGTSPAADKRTCVACPPGSVSVGGVAECTTCLAGHAPSPDKRVCQECQPGTAAASPGSSVCLPCSPGSVSAARATTCTVCTPGTFSNTTSWNCDVCPTGTVAPFAAASSCAECRPGTFMNPLRTSCDVCVGNTISPALASTCDTCPGGEVHLDHVTCRKCPAGMRSLDGACQQCPTGHVAPVEGTSVCDPCGTGFAPNFASTQCVRCDPGYVSPDGLACTACIRGSHALADNSGCLDCAPGTYGEEQGTVCGLCNGICARGANTKCSVCVSVCMCLYLSVYASVLLCCASLSALVQR